MKRSIPFLLLISAFVLNGNVSGIDQQIAPTDSVYLNTKTVVSGLNVPWEMKWGPDNWIYFTEQSGTLSKVNPETGVRKVLLNIPEVYRFRSLGLLGMAIHPDKSKPYIFLDYTYKNGTAIVSKLVRYTYTADTLINPLVLLSDIPGSTGHNGSRVTISPDGKLMMTTGDAAKGVNSQTVGSINGKILRINIDGTIPADNPFPGSAVWSMGHRNAQGLTYTKHGHLYSSEHGDAIEDELNLIVKGKNYGWPNVEGAIDTEKEKEFAKTTEVTVPVKAWTPVVAPAGIAYYGSTAISQWNNSILLVTLKTQSLRVLKLSEDGKAVKSEKIYLDHELGRLRSVCVSPTGDVYVATSNRDWNPGEGYPKKDDDKIVKVFKVKKPAATHTIAKKQAKPAVLPGAVIYNNYCGSCHKANGTGIAGVFPPLKGTTRVLGDKNELIHVLLKGLSGPIVVKGQKYDQEMPSFNFLSDQDIAHVTTYIRSQFGNKAAAVTAADVKKLRSAGK